MTTHEVRNPLNGVVGYLSLAAPLLERLDSADPAVQELQLCIYQATRCSDCCLRTLANMTSLQRLEAGLLDEHRTSVYLTEILSTVAAVVEPQMHADVPLRWHLSDELAHLAVDADRKMLIQILTNITQNAARHTMTGSVEVRAHLACDTTSSSASVELAVRDTGPGLSEETMRACFDKYTTRGGTGLGLYLTRLQVKALGGTIAVSSPWSTESSGTEFRVGLQLLKSLAAPEPPLSVPAPEFKAAGRVLVADDMRVNRSLLRRAFTTKFGVDWTVEEAATAEDALAALLPGHPFDLLVMDEIFSDIDVDQMRGSAAIRLLREREATQQDLTRLAVISCTGNAAHDRARLLECGADDVWGKPFPNAQDGSMQKHVARLLPRFVA